MTNKKKQGKKESACAEHASAEHGLPPGWEPLKPGFDLAAALAGSQLICSIQMTDQQSGSKM